MNSYPNSSETAAKMSQSPRRMRMAALALSAGLGLVGCDDNTSGKALNVCDISWENPAAYTSNPSAANTAMQTAIAELIDKIDKSGAKENQSGYRLDTIPADLIGAASAVLEISPSNRHATRYSVLQEYDNVACLSGITGKTYLTPAYTAAVGSLAAAGINIEMTGSSGSVPAK